MVATKKRNINFFLILLDIKTILMPVNEPLLNRVREALMHLPDVEEKAMFKGVCLMVDGKMCICVNDDDILCRIGPEKLEEALEKHGCHQMMHNGKPMKDYVFVSQDVLHNQQEFEYWVGLSLDFNKFAKASKKKKKA